MKQHVQVETITKKHTLDWIITNDTISLINLKATDKCISDHRDITFEIVED